MDLSHREVLEFNPNAFWGELSGGIVSIHQNVHTLETPSLEYLSVF